MTEWRSIDTAPKDGTSILGSNGKWLHVIYWSDGWDEFVIAPQLLARNASHWMPLPAPPILSSGPPPLS